MHVNKHSTESEAPPSPASKLSFIPFWLNETFCGHLSLLSKEEENGFESAFDISTNDVALAVNQKVQYDINHSLIFALYVPTRGCISSQVL